MLLINYFLYKIASMKNNTETKKTKLFRKPSFRERENGDKDIIVEKHDKKNFIHDFFIPNAQKIDCLKFAHRTLYGEFKKSNKQFGKDNERTDFRRLVDTFQGKLSEWAEFFYFVAKGLECTSPDMIVTKGHENLDGKIKGIKTINKNTKGSTHYSNMLLLERDKYEGVFYIFGGDEPIIYDIHVFCRVAVLEKNNKYEKLDDYLKGIDESNLEEYIDIISKKRIVAEVSGILTAEMFEEIVRQGDDMVLKFHPEYDLYLGIKLVAENYFCILKDLKNKDEWVEEIKNELKNKNKCINSN